MQRAPNSTSLSGHGANLMASESGGTGTIGKGREHGNCQISASVGDKSRRI